MSKNIPTRQKSTTGRINALRRSLHLLSRWTPALASRLAERLFLTPMRHRRPDRENGWRRTAKPTIIHSSSGGQLKAWVWGSGPRTALLVHGWAGRGLQLGAFAEPLVGKGFKVVAFDGPAHGDSSGRSTNLPEFADAIGDVAREVGGVDMVVAHSFGAVATLVALSRGRIDPAKLVLVASPSSFSMILGQFSEMTGFTSGVVDLMKSRLSRRFGFVWADLEPLRLASGALVPALVVHDRRDDSIPFSEGQALAETWPNARLVETEGLGHFRVLRDERVIESVLEFAASLERVGKSGSAFDFEGVPVVLGEPGADASRKPSRTRTSLFSPAFEQFDLRLEEQEIAGDLAFGRD